MHILLFFQMEDRQKIDFQLIEAKRQQRKLNFLITQTEIFAHFMANKVGTESQDETEILGQLDEKTPLPLTTMVDDYDSTVIKEQVKGVVHQIVSPILNSESTNFFNEYLLFMISGRLRKKNVLDQYKVCFDFSTTQTEKNLWKKFVKQIGENI